MKNVTFDLGNPMFSGTPACSLKIIAREMKVNNTTAILDRLYEAGGITKETYITELKELLKSRM